MIIRPADIHEDWDRAKYGFVMAARELGIECNCTLMTMWRITIDDPDELESFLEVAQELASAL